MIKKGRARSFSFFSNQTLNDICGFAGVWDVEEFEIGVIASGLEEDIAEVKK